MKRSLFAVLLLLLTSMQLPMQLPKDIKGIRYEHRVLEGPVCVHILEVDPKNADIAATHAPPQVLALAPTSEIAKAKGAFAAINGGFYRLEGIYAGSCSGILKVDGEWLSSPRLERAALGWNKKDGSVLIDRVGWRGEVKWKNSRIYLDGINQPALKDKVILYTSSFAPSTLTPSGSLDLQLSSTYQILAFNKSGNTPIPENGYVIAIGEEYPDIVTPFEVGKKLELSLQVVPIIHPKSAARWNSFDDIVGGTPLLVDNGQVITDFSAEKTRTSFLLERHPRTAVGIKADGHWLFVVIDGRQPEISLGMTMNELARFMHSIGSVSAINFDGGGSSTLYLNGSVINIPSISEEDVLREEGVERPVSDAILIYKRS